MSERQPIPGVYGDWICMQPADQWRAYSELADLLEAARAECDKLRAQRRDIMSASVRTGVERDAARALLHEAHKVRVVREIMGTTWAEAVRKLGREQARGLPVLGRVVDDGRVEWNAGDGP